MEVVVVKLLMVVMSRVAVTTALVAAAALGSMRGWRLGFSKFSLLLLLLRWTFRRHWLVREVVAEAAAVVVVVAAAVKVAVEEVKVGKEAKDFTEGLQKGKEKEEEKKQANK
jgi:hypothetical protein